LGDEQVDNNNWTQGVPKCLVSVDVILQMSFHSVMRHKDLLVVSKQLASLQPEGLAWNDAVIIGLLKSITGILIGCSSLHCPMTEWTCDGI
jgi:hypothetical protein